MKKFNVFHEFKNSKNAPNLFPRLQIYALACWLCVFTLYTVARSLYPTVGNNEQNEIIYEKT